VAEGRSGRRLGRGTRAARRRLIGADRDDLLDGAHGQALRDDAARQAFLRLGTFQAEQGPGVARAEHPRRHPLLHGRRQVQQPQGVGDVRPGAADLAGEFLVGGAEIVEELLVGRGLFERVELLTVQVLDQRVPEHVVVVRLLDDGADLAQAGPLRRAPPALARDKLVPAGRGRADDHGLQQADLPDGLGKLVECVLVEAQPRLPRVRGDRGDRDFLVTGAGHLAERWGRVGLPGRQPPGGLGGGRAARGGTVGQHRGVRDQGPEPPA
jgi:hypothetical protein